MLRSRPGDTIKLCLLTEFSVIKEEAINFFNFLKLHRYKGFT